MKVTFEMIGGPLDGSYSDSKPALAAERWDVESWYIVTEEGKIGERFWTKYIPEDSLNPEGDGTTAHFYEVVQRLQKGEELLVRARYCGFDGAGPSKP